MAYPEEIERAACTPKPPVGTEASRAAHILNTPAQDRILAALEREKARWTLRRMANRHGCRTGRCRRPEHARDAALIAELWDALGLLDEEE